MSRNTIYEDDKILLVEGKDDISGKFLQMFDRDMENETPEGEGLILDWSEVFGLTINYTGFPGSMSPKTIAHNYINDKQQKAKNNM